MPGDNLRRNPVITLMTDFGLHDAYVGMMKGVILSICPSAVIVDLTHEIAPQDIREAAFCMQTAYRFFPPGTVHVMVVDPGVGTNRAAIALKTSEYVFVGPDNGSLSSVLSQETVERVVCLDQADYFLETVSTTFHGRDIFAPVAAHLANGVCLKELGTPLSLQTIVRLEPDTPRIMAWEDGSLKGVEISGRIVRVDRFGNLLSNIDKTALVSLADEKAWPELLVLMDQRSEKSKAAQAENVLCGIVETYAQVPEQQPLALLGSSGYLEIAVNGNNAAHYFQAGKGCCVRVRHIHISGS
jgi:hypothetical protein